MDKFNGRLHFSTYTWKEKHHGDYVERSMIRLFLFVQFHKTHMLLFKENHFTRGAHVTICHKTK
jgi:hypothetical protein